MIQEDLAATLNKGSSLPKSYGDHPGWEVRYFCDVRIIEATPRPARGVDSVVVLASCHGFGRVGTDLVDGGFGEKVPWLVELDGPRVHASESAPDGGGEVLKWNKRLSKQALKEVVRLLGVKWADTAAIARRHFGLPADAPVR
ncbi:hypothetical protein ACFYM0_32775 [Streptomyces sp. NPDC006487]|uniref:hypothetical protein n=1 Tax=Streptomyces sp. NPDC006487 TaxID=3364748 RepID=UPI003688AC0B